METHIDSIDPAGPDRRARQLRFHDGSEPRTTSAAVTTQLGLVVGTAVDRVTLETALTQTEALLAKERALRLLGYRERSVAEIDRRLAGDGYPCAARHQTLERLQELDLVNDERFAVVYTRSRLAAGYGARRIAAELKQRGVEPSVAQRALHEASTPADELARARNALRGQIAADAKTRERLLRRLVSRGFDFRIALAALDADSDLDTEGPFVVE